MQGVTRDATFDSMFFENSVFVLNFVGFSGTSSRGEHLQNLGFQPQLSAGGDVVRSHHFERDGANGPL